MKKLLLLTLVSLLLLSSCADSTAESTDVSGNISDASAPAENTITESALALVNEGKTQEAYELLYQNRDNAEAKEMLSDFTVVYSELSVKEYYKYNTVTEKSYNEYGDVISEYNEYKNINYTYEYIYDSLGSIVSYNRFDKIKDQVLAVSFTYDENGNMTCEEKTLHYKDSDGNDAILVTHYYYVYDQYGNVLESWIHNKTEDRVYYHHIYVYDKYGNKIQETYFDSSNILDSTSFFIYNEKNHLVTKKKEENGRYEETVYTYNDDGDIIKSVEIVENYKYDEEKQEYDYSQKEKNIYEYNYEYEYDSNGRLTKYVSVNSKGKRQIEEYAYDSNGNKIKYVKTFNEGRIETEEYIYDEHNNVIKKLTHSNRGNKGIYEVVYEYYDDGNIKKESTVESDWNEKFDSYEYDAKGNQIRRELIFSGELFEYENSYTYDENGRIVTEYRDGSDKYRYPQSFEYSYDSNGNLLKIVQIFRGITTEYSYDEHGNVISMCRSNGDGEMKTIFEYSYEYDSSGNKIKETANDMVNPSQNKEYSYKYDENGNLINTELYSNDLVQYVRNYMYDSEGNMIKETEADSFEEEPWLVFEYTYDDFGIRMSLTSTSEKNSPFMNVCEYSNFLYFYTPNK